jgi:type III pantothenate kinase
MTERTLLVDLGNSRIKWICARAGKLDPASAGRGGPGEFADYCSRLGWAPARIRIASVAGPAAVREILDLCRDLWTIEAEELSSRREQGKVRSGYLQPTSLGVDRWLAVVGAAHEYGMPVVVWDLGTATTLDAVDASGRHLGGWILPGPGTMRAALAGHTRLPVPEQIETTDLGPAEVTSEAIIRGVLAAQLGALERFLAWAADRCGGSPRLVVTGGAAPPLLPHLAVEFTHDPWLVFRGMLVD